jgi:hypothetical protein
MVRIASKAIAGLLLVLTTGFAAGQGSAPAQTELSPATAVAIVHGLAPNDLLNVREDPSPAGAVVTRLTNGAMVKRLRCDMVKDYEWCEVEAFEQGGVRGWTPSRYLLAGAESDQDGTAAAPAAGQVVEAAASPEETEDLSDPSKLPIPSDLAARMGDLTDPDLTAEARHRAASIEAAATALTLALVAPEAPSAGEPSPGSANAEAAPDSPTSGTPSTASDAPITEAALQVQTKDAAGNAEEIPCARHLGQPMTTCRASVERKGDGAADVTVFWPDGGTRVIFFRTGKPDGSNAEGELTYTREAQLNMIRIGAAERFEILDKLPFGN